MTNRSQNGRSTTLRQLPSIDSLLQTETAKALAAKLGAESLTKLARKVTDGLRREILTGSSPLADSQNGTRASFLHEAERRMAQTFESNLRRGVQRVINATGVVLHTNLGRAPLSDEARRALIEAAGYCSLEYDIGEGVRGRRGARAEELLIELTGADASLIVNNCAAAALLVLTTFAEGGETIVSRGELVEIGGDFRVPDVMAHSGTRMIEVGTTNRTSLSDYREAISQRTRMLMRVHTSNYRIVGFTRTPTRRELAELAHASDLLLYEDAGSGALVDFSAYGIEGEPVIREIINSGVDLVTFSGDKLVGGPQAGLIVGRSELIEQMRKHPLYRALRADKLRLAALEATLETSLRDADVPVREMIGLDEQRLRARAEALIRRLAKGTSADLWALVPGESAVGGGSAPTSALPTVLIAINHPSLSATQVSAMLREQHPPVIVRIIDNQAAIDLRTVSATDEPDLEKALLAIGS